MKSAFPLLLAVVLWSGTCAAGEAARYPRPELLVEPAQLAKPDVAEQFVILDVRKQHDYDRGHVPGALRVEHDVWKRAFGEGRDAKGWGKRIGDFGIGAGSQVVLYDDKAMTGAGRIWWILTYWGVRDARLLNGGWKAWKAADRPVSKETPKASPVEFLATPRAERLATKAEILDLLRGSRLQIVDARSIGEYCGIVRAGNKKGGAIPGAKHLEWSDLIDLPTHRVRSPAELRRLFDRAGIDLDRPTATYCQSGGRAAVMVFGMELMGAKDVGNYFQSWKEWGNSDDTPVVVPEKPKTK